MFLHVTFSQVLDTTACLRQSECCLMHLAERHMHQIGCWVKSYSWDMSNLGHTVLNVPSQLSWDSIYVTHGAETLSPKDILC